MWLRRNTAVINGLYNCADSRTRAPQTLCGLPILSFFTLFPGFTSFSLFLKTKDSNEPQLETALSQGTTLKSTCLLLAIVPKLPARTWAEDKRCQCVTAFVAKVHYLIFIKDGFAAYAISKYRTKFTPFPFMAQALCWRHHHSSQCHLMVIVLPAG